jgi:hypothetical protein
MKSQLGVVRVSAEEQSEESEESSTSSSEESDDGEEELVVTEHYRDPEYWENLVDPHVTDIVVGVDPGPKLCGFFLMVRRDTPDEHGRFFVVLSAAIVTSFVGGRPIECVSAFVHFPWDNWLLHGDESMKYVRLRIEKQEQRRFGTYREDNNHLVGVLAGSARMFGVKDIEIISATVKLGRPMLDYCGMPKDTVVPRGPKNRVNRKKLGVEVLDKWMTRHRNFIPAGKISLIKQSQGIFDMCDAGLTAASMFRPTATAGSKATPRKRKRE